MHDTFCFSFPLCLKRNKLLITETLIMKACNSLNACKSEIFGNLGNHFVIFFFTQYDFSHHYQIGNDKLQLLRRFCNLDEIIGSLGNHFAIFLFKRNMISRTNSKLGITNYNYNVVCVVKLYEN